MSQRILVLILTSGTRELSVRCTDEQLKSIPKGYYIMGDLYERLYKFGTDIKFRDGKERAFILENVQYISHYTITYD